MNKNLYVVEGKTDVAKLKHIGVEYVIKTDGFNMVSRETYEIIIRASLCRPIVLLLDPDGPGKMIARRITEEISLSGNSDSIIQIAVDKTEAICHNKVGIAQMKEKDIAKYIRKYIEQDRNSSEKKLYDVSRLKELGLTGSNSQIKRRRILKFYPVEISTAKSLMNSLEIMRIDCEELRRIINEKI